MGIVRPLSGIYGEWEIWCSPAKHTVHDQSYTTHIYYSAKRSHSLEKRLHFDVPYKRLKISTLHFVSLYHCVYIGRCQSFFTLKTLGIFIFVPNKICTSENHLLLKLIHCKKSGISCGRYLIPMFSNRRKI